jgi:hypothetical protein
MINKITKPPTAAEIADWEKQVEWYREQIAEEAALEKRLAAVRSGYGKLEAAYAGMTAEEKMAVEGMYVFIHAGMIDMVKENPSPTDTGAGKAFLKMVAKAEIMENELLKLKGEQGGKDTNP